MARESAAPRVEVVGMGSREQRGWGNPTTLLSYKNQTNAEPKHLPPTDGAEIQDTEVETGGRPRGFRNSMGNRILQSFGVVK